MLYTNTYAGLYKLIIDAASYLAKDVALYALGIRACSRDVVDADELKYVHHENGMELIQL